MSRPRPNKRRASYQTAEHSRILTAPDPSGRWRAWGPYLSGRQWGTVREDYSANGDAWSYFPFDHAHQRAYRWGEDGLGGICDRYGFLNVSVALWNGKDPMLKERLFGVANGEGNHGEDVKEYFWALDGTPTHSWMQWLYRYPQGEYPYQRLRDENRRRSRDDSEFELADTGILAENRFFDVMVTYAKAAPYDVLMTIEVTNHGPDAVPVHLLPQIWFRNTWAWGRDARKPSLQAINTGDGMRAVSCRHDYLGHYTLAAEGDPEVLVCDNDTNRVAVFGAAANDVPYPKDAINRRVVHGEVDAVNHEGIGTKAAFWYSFDSVAPGETKRVRLRLSDGDPSERTFGIGFDAMLVVRQEEADEFYAEVIPPELTDEDRAIARKAFAGLLWGKQLYRFSVADWLDGDPAQPSPPTSRESIRNGAWRHLELADIVCMPDEWEYPWFAAWDLAFHAVTLAWVDPAAAKEQLLLLCREWAMHPDGQLPTYEWAFGDVNPPVHAWAAWQVYLVDGRRDKQFLARIFMKLLFSFGWWVNRKDATGSNVFEGGFLGMDNIGLFDRSSMPGFGARLEQSDATSWMAHFSLGMLTLAVELAAEVPAVDQLAITFLERFLSITRAVSSFGSSARELWNEQDGFCYDVLVYPDGGALPMRVRSMVGLLPLLAVTHAPAGMERGLPEFRERIDWLYERRPELVSMIDVNPTTGDRLLALLDVKRVQRVLQRMFNEAEFLSPHGIRSLSREYMTPYTTSFNEQEFSIGYEPGESRSGMFGGNSNWRGPIWFPVNVMLADALRAYGDHLGENFTIEFPTGSGDHLTLREAADEMDDRLVDLFRVDKYTRRRPADGARIEASDDPLWRGHTTFYEYFNGDTGEGLGATHQTGWTALVAHVLCRRHRGHRY
ncbi:MAG: MGH1-like glycoside hydrolase domain-containing protein [Jatrophihabitans sp.]|uniref:MGH1-like glycoside hydrolase domain-containing protein n=1 Tax=Jatrophihabitans sp. TaxID=1932789 RepID=UPI003F801801